MLDTRRIPEKKKKTNELLNYPMKYLNVYSNIISIADPTLFELILESLSFSKWSLRRRLNRLEDNLLYMEYYEKEAYKILDEIITYASAQFEKESDENKLSIGNIMRLEEQLNIQKHKVKTVIESCKDTIEFVKKYVKSDFPILYFDWTEIDYDPAYSDSEFGTRERVKHQERWKMVVEEIQQEKEIATKIRSSESIRSLSSISEQICNRLIYFSRQEKELLKERFKILKHAIQKRELDKFVNILDVPINGNSLNDFSTDLNRIGLKIKEI